MNVTIYKSSLKRNLNFILGIAICVVGLILCFAVLFPSITSGNSYTDLLKTLPAGMLEAIGMKGNIRDFNDYLNMNFYNSVYLYILMAYVIAVAENLVAKPIEDTSLAYYLNSPVSRKRYFYSQVSVLVSGLLLTCALSAVSGIVSKEIFARQSDFSAAEFIKDNILIGCLFLFLGSICILFGAVSKKAGTAVAYGSTIIVTEYVFDMLVKISDKVNWLKYLTVFTFYNTDQIKNGFAFFASGCVVLLAASAVLVILSAELFKRRDLYI